MMRTRRRLSLWYRETNRALGSLPDPVADGTRRDLAMDSRPGPSTAPPARRHHRAAHPSGPGYHGERRMTDHGRKTALITGSATGVGAATALMLARRGCDVVINYTRSKAEAEDTARQCREAGADVIVFQGDVADDAACRAMARSTSAPKTAAPARRQWQVQPNVCCAWSMHRPTVTAEPSTPRRWTHAKRAVWR